MPPTARKRAAKPAELGSKKPANVAPPSKDLAGIGDAQVDDLEALRNEVATDDPLYTEVPFKDGKLRVREFLRWKASTTDLLAAGRFTLALSQIIHPDDFRTIYAPADPEIGDIIVFLRDMEQVTGVPLGMLLAPLTR